MVLEVYRESQWDHIVDIQVFLLTVCFHIKEKLIFGRKGLMPINMINQLSVTEFA